MTDREDKIRQRAYGIWEQEGYPHGRADDHWHRAAREVEGPSPAEPDLIPHIGSAPSLQPEETVPAKKAAPRARKAAAASAAGASTTKKRTTTKKT